MRRSAFKYSALLGASALTLALAQAAQGQTTTVPEVTGNPAAAVSADGAYVVGGYNTSVWEAATGAVRNQGGLPPEADAGPLIGDDVSSTGVAVGGSDIEQRFGGVTRAVAWYWRPSAMPQALPHIAGLNVAQSGATGITPDGSVIVGWAGSGGQLVGERWVLTSGAYVPSSIGTIGGASVFPQDVNANGAVIVGELDYPGAGVGESAFRWTQAQGVTDIGGLPGATSSIANGVSGDGLTIVGSSNLPRGALSYTPRRAFRWTEQTGAVDLGFVAGNAQPASVTANAASFDGSVIVGSSSNGLSSNTFAFRWTQAGGMKDLNALLVEAGVNMTNIGLLSATDVAANGQFIVGEAATANGSRVGYYVRYVEGAPAPPVNPAAPQLTGGPAAAVSPNGGFVVSDYASTVWNAATARSRPYVSLPEADYGPLIGHDVSDAGVAVGTSDVEQRFGGFTRAVAWYWPAASDRPLALPHVAGAIDNFSAAYGITPDGSIIVGTAQIGNRPIVERWDLVNGAYAPSEITALSGVMTPAALSADGTVIVGDREEAPAITSALRWTQAGGVVDLGDLPGAVSSTANAVSGDGLTVVGASSFSRGALSYTPARAFRWTAQTGISDLGSVAGYSAPAQVVANAASFDGSVIVGQSTLGLDTSKTFAFRWTQAGGMRDLNTLLVEAGVDMSRIGLLTATDVTANGEIIVGKAAVVSSSEPMGYYVRYVAPAAPPPGGPGDPGGPIAGMTTLESLRASAQGVAESQANLGVQQGQLAGNLLGRGAPMSGGSQAGAYAAAGSFAAGAYGQTGVGPVTILGGVGTTSIEPEGADLKDAALLALAVRADASPLTLSPFAELGGWVTTEGDYSFSRTYMNGAGTATGRGVTSGDMSYVFGRLGVRPIDTAQDQLVLSVELGRQRVDVDGYAETADATNPFPATIEGGHQALESARLQAQWSHALSDRLRLTGALEHVWESDPYVQGMRTSVLGVGILPAPSIGSSEYWLYSLRGGYRFTPRITGELFVQGTAGGDRTDADAHAGAAIRVEL